MTRHALAVPHWGPFGDPRRTAELAPLAEQAGWDAYFTWGGFVARDEPPAAYDPWIMLAAAAAATSTIRIGTCIAPLPAYQPHVVASIVASLDVLSEGRMILGVGIGDEPVSFEAFGQPGDARTRAAQLDEALDVITRLWSGERVDHLGEHYVVDGFTLRATPVQQPRVPIWVGGDSAPAKRRAARWDGWIGPDEDPMQATAADLRSVRAELLADRDEPIDIAWAGAFDPDDDPPSWVVVPALGTAADVIELVEHGPDR